MVSLAILIKHNRGKCKTMLSIFIVCAATYLQISYCSLFYEWGVVICVTLPVFQLTFGFLISKFSQSITDLCTGCSNLMFSTIWANQMVGFLWFHHESSDLETVGIASACALVGVVIVFYDIDHYDNEIQSKSSLTTMNLPITGWLGAKGKFR